MKISVSSYSYAQYIRAGKMTQLDCVAKAKEMGFETIEFTDLEGETLEEQKEYAKKIKAEADRVGVEINAYTVGANLYKESQEAMDAEVERVKGQLEVAAILGAKILRHDACWEYGKTGAGRSFDLMLPKIAENARKIADYGQMLGIKTCCENHGKIAQDSDRMERLFNAVNHDNFGLLVDMGNFAGTGEDPVYAVSRVAPYAIHAHAKDVIIRDYPFDGYRWKPRSGGYTKSTAVGEGEIPVARCVRILKRAGYDGFLTIEYEGLEDCIEGIATGLKNLTKILEDLEREQ